MNTMNVSAIANLHKLKQFQTYLERKNDLSKFFAKYGDPTELEKYKRSLEKNRKQLEEQNKKELDNIISQLDAKINIVHSKKIRNLDLQQFKTELLHIKDTLDQFQRRILDQLEILQKEETQLVQDMEFYKLKLDEWDTPIVDLSRKTVLNYKNGYRPPSATNISYSINLRPEVREFMQFVCTNNGHENGWKTEDHQVFLKIRPKCLDSDQLVRTLQDLLPISREEIIKHEEWYEKYMKLRMESKEAINKWREVKNCIQNPPQYPELISPKGKSRSAPVKPLVTKENARIQRQIQMWKDEKIAEKQRLFDEHNNSRIQKKKIIDAKKQKRNNEMKRLVDIWRRTKSLEQRTNQLEKQQNDEMAKKIRAFEANKMIKEFQAHDDFYIERIRASRSTKYIDNNDKCIKRSNSSEITNLNRDPDRIFKPTKQWLQRTTNCNNNIENPSGRFVADIKTVPKLKVPQWRIIEP